MSRRLRAPARAAAIAALAALGCGGEHGPRAGADAGAGSSDGGGDADAAPGAPDAAPPRTLTAAAPIEIACAGAVIPVDGKVDCAITIRWPEGDVAYQGPVGIGLHGRSSSGFPKKSYAIELRDDAGLDAEVGLFGMGEEADFLLNGMFIDRALVRNTLAYDLFRAMGGWAPDTRYVTVALDGDDLGIYLLTERIERSAARLGLPHDDGSGDTFIVRAAEQGIATALQAKPWEPVYPDVAPEAAPPPGMIDRLAALDAAVLEDRPFDELDLDALVDFVILEEALKNNDAYFLSHNLFTSPGQPLRPIPWDLDLTLGQPSYNDNERADLWIAYRPELIGGPAGQAAFRERLAERWAELRAGLFATDAILARIDAARALLGDAAIEANWQRWDLTNIAEQTWFPLYAVATPADEYAAVAAFVEARLAWVDANITEY